MKKSSEIIDCCISLSDFRFFFLEKYGFIQEIFPNKPLEFIRAYPNKNLAIVVTIPIKKNWFFSFVKGKRIQFEVKRTSRITCLQLTDSIANHEWESVTEKKVQVLMDLINDISKCGSCGVYHFPSQGINLKANPKGTQFVELVCPKCDRRSTTSFRHNTLKSRLHRFLKRKK